MANNRWIKDNDWNVFRKAAPSTSLRDARENIETELVGDQSLKKISPLLHRGARPTSAEPNFGMRI